MIIHLKWNPGDTSAKAVLKVYDQDDKQVKVYTSSESAFAYVNIADLGEDKSLEYKIRVEAYRGDTDYSLHVVKPGEAQERQMTAFQWIWMFDIEVKKNNPQGEWVEFLKRAKAISTNLTVKVFDQSGTMVHIDRCKTGETVDISALKAKLTPGHYKLQITDNAFNLDLASTYREFITSGVTPLDIRTHFLNRSIQGGQTDKYTLNLKGEQFIWFVWEKVLSDQPDPHLAVVLRDANGRVVRKADAEQGTGFLKVGDLQGVYNLQVWCATPAHYAFGIENPEFGSYSLATLQDYVLEDEVDGAEGKVYTVTFSDNLPKLIDIVFTNRASSQVNVTLSIDGVAQPALTLAAGQRYTHTISVTPQGNQKKSILQLQASGQVGYTIDMDYSAIEAKVVKDSLIFDPTKLVYLQGNISLDWKKIDSNAKGSYLYWDYETLLLLVKKELTSGAVTGTSDYVKLDKWELVPVAGVTQNGENGNTLVLEPLGEETKTGEHNAILLVKDELKYDRLMVKWLYDGATPLKVGTLKGYRNVNGKYDLVIEEDLYMNRINLDALWAKFPYKSDEPWFQAAYDNIALAREGIEWTKIWSHKRNDGTYYYTEQEKTSSCTIPLQMLIGQVGQETSYGKYLYRYEPFKDAYYFGERIGMEGYIAGELIKNYPEYVVTDATTGFVTPFEYFWTRIGKTSKFDTKISTDIAVHENGYLVKLNPLADVDVYPPKLWGNYPLANGRSKNIVAVVAQILNNTNLEKEVRIKNSKKCLEILLNYGPTMVEKWYNNGMKNKDDPTSFAFVWEKIGDVYNIDAISAVWSPDKWPNTASILAMRQRFEELHQEGLTRDCAGENRRYSEIFLEIFISYGKQKAENWDNNYYMKKDSTVKELFDPTRIQYIWDHIGSKYKVNDTLEIHLNPNSLDSSYTPEQWIQEDACDYIKDLKKSFDEYIIYLNGRKMLVNAGENEIVYKVLEYLIKYGKIETKKWLNLISKENYTIPTHGYYDPEMSSTSFDDKIVKPFIAQTNLSSSYGHLQVLVTSAYMAGCLRSKDNDLSLLINNPLVAFEYGVRFLSTEKMWEGLHYSGVKDLTSMQNADMTKWIQFWNEILYRYNGGQGYPGDIRDKEIDFLKKVGLS